MTTRALVLGGGGPVGIAWESGLAAGLDSKGVHLATADAVIGTSAGSAVGAQLAMGRSPESLYQSVLAPATGAPARQQAASGPPNLLPLMQFMQKAASGADPEEVRREIGKFALEARTMPEEDFVAGFGAMLSSARGWPAPGYRCTACDAETGEFVTWTAESKVDVGRAVASSCAVPGIYPPITINGRRYIDGGMRSATNADLAAGHDRTIVVSVTVGATAHPLAAIGKERLDRELEAVRAAGGEVEPITPDKPSIEAFGINLMDFTRRKGAAEAGFAQGQAEAARLKDFWG